ncbi:MAG: HAD-IB family hydrolase [Pseudomonadota bacterium]
MSVAFFDLDGTLIKTKSLLSFFEYYIDTNPTLKTRLSWQLIEYAMQHLISVGVATDVVNQWFYQKNFGGLDVSELATSASAWFEEKRHTNFFFDDVVAKLKEHKNLGAEIVIVTDSFYEVVKPIADYLEVSDLLCAPLEIIDGKYSGQLTALPMIGKGKAEAIKRYLSLRGNAEPTYGYGDDFSDMNFLELVDKPVASSACGPTNFLKIARSQSWKIIEAS